MKKGLFMGSFNPPHKEHLNIALGLLKQGVVDLVDFVVANDHYSKNGLVSFQHRVQMVREMISGHKKLEVNLIEKDFEKYAYTINVLDKLNELYLPNGIEIYLIIGADNLVELKNWVNHERIMKDYKIIVINRNDININRYIEENFGEYKDNFSTFDYHSTLSSTFIRNKLIQNLPTFDCLNQNVSKYINEHKLYKELK